MMNNEGNGDIVYHDSIHPPDLILLDVNNHQTSNENNVPSPDSPLSSAPNSPLRLLTNVDGDGDGDADEEEKKEEEQNEDSAEDFAMQEEVPLDECIDNDIGLKNSSNSTSWKDEYPNDESKITSKADLRKGESTGSGEKNPPLSPTNSAAKPFDEDLQKSQTTEVVGDLEFAPDDEKKIDDSSLPPVPQAVRSSDSGTVDELMKPGPALQTKISQTEHEIENGKNNCDEPPSLSLVEEAKKRLSEHGLSGFSGPSHSPSSKYSSSPESRNKKAMSIANDVNSNYVDVDEPPSLSRVEQAKSKGEVPIESYNDIPSTTVPVATVSGDMSPPKDLATTKTIETSFVQPAAVVSPDGDFEVSDLPSSTVVEEINPSDAPLYRNTCHVIPYADDEDEIMISKNRGPVLSSKVTENISYKDDGEDPMDPDVTMETTESSLSQEKSNDARGETLASFPKMTSKQDLKGSEHSAKWLKEELQRRSEINSAIESRGQFGLENYDANDNTGSILQELPSISSPPDLENSQSTMDEEVAAITANDDGNRSTSNQNISYSSDGQEPPSLRKTGVEQKVSRKLDYGDFEEHPDDELIGQTNSAAGYPGFRPVLDYQDIQHEMKKFASETRAALRDQSFTHIADNPSSSVVPVAFSSPISVNRSTDVRTSDDHRDFEMNAVAKSRPYYNKSNNVESISINFSDMEAGEVPKMLISMDSFDGIASGDIFLSLLSENTGRAETSDAATWADRVHGAIWRARGMRKSMMPAPPKSHLSRPLVRGGSHTVASVQQAALLHLKRDEIDDSINLVEGIVFAYYSYFERSLNYREKNPTSDPASGPINFKPYIGMALHNLGILNLLKGDYDEALSYFTRAVDNRKGNLGEDHPHYISSLVRLAVCRFALNEFAEAHARLEEALACAKRRRSTTLEGRLQIAEILNNLACLAYMSGQPTTASSYYRDSMDIQFGALNDSLYLGNAMSGQSISLNISIARANIGFIKLVTKDLSVATTALENALMEQQILLSGINDTLIATMDHLALSNLMMGSQEKAALMYNRILTLQQNEYGPNDRRCLVTVEKMNMVQGKGVQYEGTIEELRKTFSVPAASKALNPSHGSKSQKGQRSPRREKHAPIQNNGSTRTKKKKGLKAFTSMIKKHP